MRFVAFFLVAFLVLGLGHYYLWRRIVRDTGVSGRIRRILTAVILLAALFLVPVWLLSLRLPRALVAWPAMVAFTWKGLVYYAILILLCWDVVLLLALPLLRLRRRSGVQGEPDPARRLFLRRAAAGTATLGSAAVGLVGVRHALHDMDTPRVPVKLERLPRTLQGLRIAVISDLHLGPLMGSEFTERIASITRDLKPDLVALTGDLVDGSVEHLGRDVSPLADIPSRFGTFFITGNHEYYSGPVSWMDHFRRLGIRVLDNERVTIGDAGGSFDLAGVHDFGATRLGLGPQPDLRRALAGRDPERELVLLAHQPKHVDEAAEHHVGLQISGHTHGGQIWPFGALTALAQPYIQGLHRHHDRTWIYVSRGTGFWGPPMRILAPPEISLIVLV